MVASCIELETQLVKYQSNRIIKSIYYDFQRDVVSLDFVDFVESYATIVTYSLFCARFLSNVPLSLKEVPLVLQSLDFRLRNVFRKLYHEIYLIQGFKTSEMNRLILHLNSLNLDHFLQSAKEYLNQNNILFHFYEYFLAKLNPKKRYNRGVFFTPDSIVSFLIRGTDFFLESLLNIDAGLLNETVKILDPAAGTGTFICAILEYLKEKLEFKKSLDELKDVHFESIIKDRFYGFELLPTPFILSRMNIQLKLEALGVNFSPVDLDGVIKSLLVNTFVPPESHRTETEELATNIKYNTNFNVVIGNPPYSKYSANKECEWIENLLRGRISEGARRSSYYEAEGKPLGERKVHLSDDYVKFLRFAQWRIERTGYGIVSFVTPHGFLTNVSFRGMREQLLVSFDYIYILDLHGNVLKGEKSPNGSTDENVFNIKQGICIIFLIKTKKKTSENTGIFQFDLWGTRDEKYHFLDNNQIPSIQWSNLSPRSPNFLFRPEITKFIEEYEEYWQITNIFQDYGVGIVTARDKLTLHKNVESLWKTVTEFVDLDESEARRKFSLPRDTESWSIAQAQADLRRIGVTKSSELKDFYKQYIKLIQYRPFVKRYTIYTGLSNGFLARPVFHIMRNLTTELIPENTSLVTTRLTKGELFNHVFLTNLPIEQIFLSSKTSNSAYIFPTYRLDSIGKNTQRYYPNFTSNFIEYLSKAWSMIFKDQEACLEESLSSNSIICYIYAILHSPSFKERYVHFLKSDFPRIPISTNPKLIRKLIIQGAKLRDLHIFDVDNDDTISEVYLRENGIKFNIKPQSRLRNLEKASFYDSTLFLNKSSYIQGLPSQIMNYYIGGYPIIKKWIRDNNNHALDKKFIMKLKNIIFIILSSQSISHEIDQIILSHGGFPIK